ncbi:hypothetical protein ACVWYQ_003128 [Bradyrhizobium sp. USDA 3397]
MNMNLTEADLIARLSAIPAYGEAFTRAFGDDAISRPRIEAALATFQRTIVAGESPFDRWIIGDETAIKAGCSTCHKGPSFTDGSFHDIGAAGRLFPRSEKLRYAFKTPTLRDVARRAPYMHDGSVATLEDVIELYDKGGIDRPSRSPSIKPLSLTPGEKKDLVALLQSLNASSPLATFPRLPPVPIISPRADNCWLISAIVRQSFLQEGVHSFLLVSRAECAPNCLPLEFEPSIQSGLKGGEDGCLGELGRTGRLLGDHFGDFERSRLCHAGFNNFSDEASLHRSTGRNGLASQYHQHGHRFPCHSR